jgi:hypothetical protein
MKRLAVVATMLLCSALPAAAQTEGRVSVGGSVTFIKPTDSEVQSLWGYGPLVRLNPKKGWGFSGGLNWFRADLDNPSGESGDFARLRVRPLMAGVAYTIGNQPALVSFSIVAGPSFNDLDFRDEYLDRLPAGSPRPELDADNSFAVRGGVTLTYTVAPRIAIIGFGGYMVNRPDVVYRDGTGQEYRNRWKADSIALSVGAVYSLF